MSTAGLFFIHQTNYLLNLFFFSFSKYYSRTSSNKTIGIEKSNQIKKKLFEKLERDVNKISNPREKSDSILKYFHPTITKTNDSSKRTNQQSSDIVDDHGNARMVESSLVSSLNVMTSVTTSTIIKSKYFLHEIIPVPCPKNPLISQTKINNTPNLSK